jgi:hypothetical protein
VSGKKFYWLTLIPSVFMTAVTLTYLLIAPEGFRLPVAIGYPVGIGCALLTLVLFYYFTGSQERKGSQI